MLHVFDEGDYGQVVREDSGRFGAEPDKGNGLTPSLCALFTSTLVQPTVGMQGSGPLSLSLAGCPQPAPLLLPAWPQDWAVRSLAKGEPGGPGCQHSRIW